MKENNNKEKEINNSDKQAMLSLNDSDTDLLFCQQERLDQNSPELWPETIPGVSEFTPSSLFSSPPKPVLDVVSCNSILKFFLYSLSYFLHLTAENIQKTSLSNGIFCNESRSLHCVLHQSSMGRSLSDTELTPSCLAG